MGATPDRAARKKQKAAIMAQAMTAASEGFGQPVDVLLPDAS